MASAKAVVTVLDGRTEVEAGVRRPIRLTPDGYAGVAYAGSVYPLRPGDAIDLGGPSWEIADCDRFLFAGADIPYAPPPQGLDGVVGTNLDIEWYLETSEYGHTVVFNASERVASSLIGTFEAAGLDVQRWDVSHRPADDGNFYDWFARLRSKGSRDEVVALIHAAIAPAATGPATPIVLDPTAVRLAESDARIEELLDQLYALSRRAEAAERDVARLRGRIESAEANERSYRTALRLAEDRTSDLHEQLTALRTTLGSAPDTTKLIQHLADAEELRELALAENAVLLEGATTSKLEAVRERGRADDLSDQVDALIDRVTELETLEAERLRASTAVRTRRRGLVEFLPTAFSRLEFVLDAVEVIASLESPAPTMRVLADIDAGHLVGKDLEGMRGWFEVPKLATGIAGSEQLGRIYYRPDSGRVLVSVHIKQDDKQQKRHIDRLRAL